VYLFPEDNTIIISTTKRTYLSLSVDLWQREIEEIEREDDLSWTNPSKMLQVQQDPRR
jgi:hypothetical protein